MKETFTIRKENGAIKAAALRAHMDSLPEGSYFVTVEGADKKKTTAQNSYLHALFTIAAKELNREGFGDGTQWTCDRVKSHCKRHQLYPMVDVLLPSGVVEQVWKDTRDLTKEDAMETITRVIQHFAEWGIILPEPNEQLRIAA